jgi:hypothetical protein
MDESPEEEHARAGARDRSASETSQRQRMQRIACTGDEISLDASLRANELDDSPLLH